MNRRQFLSSMAAVPALAPLAPAHAGIDPIKRSGNARMKLGLAAYRSATRSQVRRRR